MMTWCLKMGYTGYAPAVQSFFGFVQALLLGIMMIDFIYTPAATFFLGFVDMGIMMINQCLLSDKVCHASAKDNGKFHGDAYGVHCRTHERGDPPV